MNIIKEYRTDTGSLIVFASAKPQNLLFSICKMRSGKYPILHNGQRGDYGVYSSVRTYDDENSAKDSLINNTVRFIRIAERNRRTENAD